MDTPETNEQPATPTGSDTRPAIAPSPVSRSGAPLFPQACANCDGAAGLDSNDPVAAASYVYALGRVEARFPCSSVEKKFAQATGRASTNGHTALIATKPPAASAAQVQLAIALAHACARCGVAPPLLNAWQAYLTLARIAQPSKCQNVVSILP
jgi:hypothetical protein